MGVHPILWDWAGSGENLPFFSRVFSRWLDLMRPTQPRHATVTATATCPLQSPWCTSHVRACDTSKEHGQSFTIHVYGLKSTPITQGLVKNKNVKHTYGSTSTPIIQGLVYDINVTHTSRLRESERTYGSVSTPITQRLVEIINAKDTKVVIPPKVQGLVNITHCNKTCMLNWNYHKMSAGKGAKRSTSGAAGKKMTSSEETTHASVYLLPTEEDSSWMSGGKAIREATKRTNSGVTTQQKTFSDEMDHETTFSSLRK